jgi:hypothetical protein
MADLSLPADYADLLLELLDAHAEFVVVGGWAVAVHGHARATDDLDVLVRPTLDNAARVYEALQKFGAPVQAHGVTAELFSKERYGYRIGIKPTQIEILTSISGVTFEQANQDRVLVTIEDHPVPFIGRAALLDNKRAAGRHKDLADVEALESPDDESR